MNATPYHLADDRVISRNSLDDGESYFPRNDLNTHTR